MIAILALAERSLSQIQFEEKRKAKETREKRDAAQDGDDELSDDDDDGDDEELREREEKRHIDREITEDVEENNNKTFLCKEPFGVRDPHSPHHHSRHTLSPQSHLDHLDVKRLAESDKDEQSFSELDSDQDEVQFYWWKSCTEMDDGEETRGPEPHHEPHHDEDDYCPLEEDFLSEEDDEEVEWSEMQTYLCNVQEVIRATNYEHSNCRCWKNTQA